MKSNFEKIAIEILGGSHEESIGLKLFGLPAGEAVSYERISAMLGRRKSGNNPWSTPRLESDAFEILSGVKNGRTTGGVFEAVIKNENVRKADYLSCASVPRPSHADYAAFAREGAIPSGGGRFSGRMTAPVCIAGALAEDILEKRGVKVIAYASEIGGIKAGSLLESAYSEADAERAVGDALPLLDAVKKTEITAAIEAAAKDGDSLGGVIECAVFGLKAGEIGECLFEGLEGKIAYAAFGIPAVKGVEFGAGFSLSSMRGSEANDAFTPMSDKDGNVKIGTFTNRSGGINGGICNGMPIIVRIAVRPTPSISKPQESVDLKTMERTHISVVGRHDACIVPRAVPAAESAVALAVLDEMLKYGRI